MTRGRICLVLGMIGVALLPFFIGEFYDRHTDGTIFLKYRPTLKYYFYPPQYHLSELSPAERAEERALFQEFIVDRNLLHTDGEWLSMSSFIIQAIISLLFIGGCSLILKRPMRYWQLPVHYLLGILITDFGIIALAFSFGPPIPIMAIIYNMVAARLLMIRSIHPKYLLRRWKSMSRY